MADRSVSVPMTVSDLERRDARSQIFRLISLITLVTVLPRTTKFGRITHVVAEERISRGSATPLPQGGGAPALPIWGFPSICAHTLSRRQNYQIWRGNIWRGGLFSGVSHAPFQGGGPSAPRFLVSLSISAYIFCKTTKFHTNIGLTYMGRRLVSRWSATPTPYTLRWRGPSAPQFWGSLLLMRIHPLSQNYQIWRGNTYEEGLGFRGQPRLSSQDSGVSGLPNFGVLLYAYTQ